MKFKVLKAFQHLFDPRFNAGEIHEVRDDLVVGLVKEGWIEAVKPLPAVNKK